LQNTLFVHFVAKLFSLPLRHQDTKKYALFLHSLYSSALSITSKYAH